MAIVLKDRVKQSASAPGTGTITLGSTPTGFQAFSAIGNGNVTYFAIVDSASGAWEVNYGTYTSSGTTLTRNATPLSSSNAGALVNFTGTVDVFCTYPSEKAIYEEAAGNVIFDGGPITVVGNGVTSYTSFSNYFAEMFGNANTYVQSYIQNQNNGSDASADYVALNDIGTDTTYYIDMGINSSGYTSGTYQIYTPNSGYLYTIGGGSKSKMFVGSGDDDLILHAGGFATTNIAATISGTNQTFAIAKAATVGGTLGVTGATTFGNTVTLNADPAANLQAATKQYVDQKASTGLSYHAAVQAATTQSLAAQTGGTVTYNQPGGAGVGVGATITLSVALTTLDGYSLANTNRVLVKNESNQTYNGVYTWATGGTVLTRATDADTAGGGVNELSLNDYFYVQNGTVNKGVAYVLSSPSTAIVFGTSNIAFSEFSSAQIYTGTSPINVSSTVISLTTVPATLGGTGTATVATGDLLYGSATNTWSKLTKGSAYQPLVMDASGTNVQWNAIALNQANAVSGALQPVNGGTGINSYTVGDMVYANTTTTLDKVTPNSTTTKKFLTQTGTGSASQAPVWGTISGSDVSGNISGSAGSVANALTLGTYLTGGSFDGSAAVTATVDATSANTASKVVARDASGNFSAGTITATLSGSATSATTATNLAGGVANQIPYQTSAGTTSFITAASGTNYVLNYTGSAFNWVAGTISGVALGSNLNSLTAGTYLTGTAYNGSAAQTWTVDATSANTASKVVARDASGNFSAGTITAALSGNATTATTATNVSGTVAVANGGTGQTSYTNGQLLIGNTTGNTLTKATLTAGSGISITNGGGSITIANTASVSAATPTALGTVYGNTNDATPFLTALGYQAGNATSGINNSFVGYQAGLLNSTGTNNTSFGFKALDANTTSSNSTAVGSEALGASTGSDNTAVGFNTMLNNTSAFGSTAVGSQALRANTANQNSAFGADAGRAISTGSQNTVIGYGAGFSGTNNLTTGQGNIIIGYNAAASAAGVNGEVTIGNSADIVSTRLRGIVEHNMAIFEQATVSATAATGTIAYYARSQSVLYYTSNASANWTVNLTGASGVTLNSIMQTGQSMTVAFLVTQGSTAYYNNVVQVDGTGVTPKYQGGTAWSSGNASSIDVYVYTVIKTASATFTVLASQTKFA